MPKKAKELTARAVDALKTEGRFAVGGVDGLHLLIAGNGRSWILRVKIGARRTDIGLGSSDDVSLADAREKAREYRRKVREGIDPMDEKRQARAALQVAKVKSRTFKECAEAFLEAQEGKWKNANAKHVKQWSATLETYAYPVIGALPVSSIDTGLVLEVIQPLWASKTETASRLRGRIEKVLGWATFRGYRSGENPARWKDHLDHELPARTEVRKVKHHASLDYKELGAFMADLRKRDGISARALEFAILCASRSREVREATWSEFDLEAKTWTIPADRMKAGREHVVPLSAPALAILKAQPRIEGTDFVFPAPRGGALSDMALTAVLKRMDRNGLTQHGFRSTFREWGGEVSKHPREVVEHALAHQLADKAEAAYQRGSLMPKRVVLMADWAKFCAIVPTGANVVAMRGAA